MSSIPPNTLAPVTIEQLLLRKDTWLGHSQSFIYRETVPTGFTELDNHLLNQGWPLGCFIEICQQGMQAEWQLLMPALLNMSGLIVLLNPPAIPFAQAFIQKGVDLERLMVVTASNKNHFIACFTELVRANVGVLLAWQPDDNLTYTELRKCALASAEGSSLCMMFRPPAAQQHSSPAVLRVFAQLVSTGLAVTLFKQKGFSQRKQPQPIVIPLPKRWQPALPYYALNRLESNRQPAVDVSGSKPQRLASVIPWRGKP